MPPSLCCVPLVYPPTLHELAKSNQNWAQFQAFEVYLHWGKERCSAEHLADGKRPCSKKTGSRLSF